MKEKEQVELVLKLDWIQQVNGMPISIDPKTMNVVILSLEGCKELLERKT